MNKKIIFIALVLIFLCSLKSLATPPMFLNKSDLEAARMFDPLWSTKAIGPNQYWLCLNSKKDSLSIKCDDLGYNESEGYKEELQITAISGKLQHEYFERHGILKEDCRELKKNINSMFQGSKQFCIRGSLVEKEPNLISWIFWEAKNHKKSVTD